MRHAKTGRKFSRTPSHRKAMFRNMVTDLLRHGRLETTVHKAKELRGVVEKYITIAGNDTLAAKRQAYSYLNDKAVVHKLFAEIGPQFKDRPGGYTRVVRTRTRTGDAAELAVIELVQDPYKPTKKKKSKAKATAKKSAKTKAAAEEVADVVTEDTSSAEASEVVQETKEEKSE
ncbi:MAG: 50S ribosomal protein L17 [Bdellovibrionota bacterium]